MRLLKIWGADVWRVDALDGGVPDLTVIHQGKSCFIEVKTIKGRVKDTQNDFIKKLKNAYIARSVQDVAAILLIVANSDHQTKVCCCPPLEG